MAIFDRVNAKALSNGFRVETTGTIEAIGEGTPFYVIDGDDGQCYEPTELPRSFRGGHIRIKMLAEKKQHLLPVSKGAQVIKILHIERER